MKNKIQFYKYEITVFVFFILVRLPSLGNDIFNTDAWKWKTRTFNFGSGVFGLNFEQTIQRYHPGVVLMWIGSAAIKFYNLYYEIFYRTSPPDNTVSTVFGLHFTQKLFVVFIISATLAAIFYALRNLFSIKYAFVFTLLLVFEPFYTALTRVYHLEGLMSTFMLASFVWFFMYLLNISKTKYLIVSSLFASLAVLTKTSSLFLLPFIGLILFLNFYSNNKNILDSLKKSLKIYLKWFGALVIFFVVFWPAMWVTPIAALKTLYLGIFETGVEEGHGQIYFGNFVSDPGLSFYITVFLFRSSVYLLVGLVGYFAVFRKLNNKKIKTFAFYALLFSLLYAITMTLPSKKLDRYLLPSIISLLLVSAVFFEWLAQKVAKDKKFYISSILIMLPAIIFTLYLHPDYFSYYNPFLGGLKTGINSIEPKWLIGQKEITAYFENVKSNEGLDDFKEGESLDEFLDSDQIKNRLTIGFPEKYYTQIWPFINKIGARATIKDITAQAVNTKYFVYPVWDDDSRNENRFKIEYIGGISLRGTEVYRVYRKLE